MQPDRPLLTIAIPTWNRSACLMQLLELLVVQIIDRRQVEVIVSDNASTDNTQHVVCSFQRRGAPITYIRNQENVGAENNVVQCFEQARGEYVWILGDDDLIVPGGLDAILPVLEARQYDLIYVQARGFRGSYNPPREARPSYRVRSFASPPDFALYVHCGFTFISGNIIRKAKLESPAAGHYGKFNGSGIVQLSWTFALLQRSPQCACVTGDLVASREGHTGGHGTCHVFGANLRAIVEESFGLESPIGRAIMNRVVQSWLPWAMMESRRAKESRHTPENPVEILGPLFRGNVRYWVFLYPVLRLPLVLAKCWLFGVKVVNRLDQALGYPMSR